MTGSWLHPACQWTRSWPYCPSRSTRWSDTTPSWPPGEEEHDFDCDGFVGVSDLSWFATGWSKFVDDRTILYPPCSGRGRSGGRLGDDIDIALRLVALSAPSETDTLTTLPDSLLSVGLGDTYFVEFWVSDVGDINTGLTSVYVDLTLPATAGTLEGIDHGEIFTVFTSGDAGEDGIIDGLGGSTLPGGVGIEPEWVRVVTIEVSADGSAPSATYSLAPSEMGVAGFGRGAIPWASIALDSVVLAQGSGVYGDVDGDGDVDLEDFATWSTCMTHPNAGPHSPGCDALDFDADQDVDLFDFGWFQQALINP